MNGEKINVSFYTEELLKPNQGLFRIDKVIRGDYRRKQAFLKWKAPIVNWIFAVAFLASQFIGEKTLLETMIGHTLTLPKSIWLKMNISWVIFFTLLGAANLFVAFTFHEIWVDFKVFGSLILTFLFVIGQFLVISKHIQAEEK